MPYACALRDVDLEISLNSFELCMKDPWQQAAGKKQTGARARRSTSHKLLLLQRPTPRAVPAATSLSIDFISHGGPRPTTLDSDKGEFVMMPLIATLCVHLANLGLTGWVIRLANFLITSHV